MKMYVFCLNGECPYIGTTFYYFREIFHKKIISQQNMTIFKKSSRWAHVYFYEILSQKVCTTPVRSFWDSVYLFLFSQLMRRTFDGKNRYYSINSISTGHIKN